MTAIAPTLESTADAHRGSGRPAALARLISVLVTTTVRTDGHAPVTGHPTHSAPGTNAFPGTAGLMRIAAQARTAHRAQPYRATWADLTCIAREWATTAILPKTSALTTATAKLSACP